MKDMRMNNQQARRTLWGLTALAAGAATFWLLTRRETKEKMSDAAVKIRDTAEEYGDKIKDKVTYKSDSPFVN